MECIVALRLPMHTLSIVNVMTDTLKDRDNSPVGIALSASISVYCYDNSLTLSPKMKVFGKGEGTSLSPIGFALVSTLSTVVVVILKFTLMTGLFRNNRLPKSDQLSAFWATVIFSASRLTSKSVAQCCQFKTHIIESSISRCDVHAHLFVKRHVSIVFLDGLCAFSYDY